MKKPPNKWDIGKLFLAEYKPYDFYDVLVYLRYEKNNYLFVFYSIIENKLIKIGWREFYFEYMKKLEDNSDNDF